jgi:hypothetical protein
MKEIVCIATCSLQLRFPSFPSPTFQLRCNHLPSNAQLCDRPPTQRAKAQIAISSWFSAGACACLAEFLPSPYLPRNRPSCRGRCAYWSPCKPGVRVECAEAKMPREADRMEIKRS